MVAMTTTEPWPAAGQLFTVEDLERTPNDGRRYELVDGVLIVSPAPQLPHQEVLGELLVQLRQTCPPGLAAVPGPGVRMSDDTEVIPDLVVIRQDQLAGRWVNQVAAAGRGDPVAEHRAVRLEYQESGVRAI